MDPSITWFFQYKFVNKIVTFEDIQNLDNYFCFLWETAFQTLQNSPEIYSTLNLSIFFIHYLLNRLQHFRKTLLRYTQTNLRHNINPRPLGFNIGDCKCILCKFPNLKIDILDTNIDSYYKNLSSLSTENQKFMLSVLEKCFDVQCIHTMFIQQEFPQLDYQSVEKYVTSFAIE